MTEGKSEKVYKVFENIAEGYDAANDRISLGMQKSWKKELVDALMPASSVLDVCTGTGDIALAVKKENPSASICGLDFSPAMLEVAKSKKGAEEISWVQGDAMNLPFADESFEAACISFGLRNTPDYGAVIKEMRRVLKPGGIFACLDSFVPENAFIRTFYGVYFGSIMPLIGGATEHKEEYLWLNQSTKEFLSPTALTRLISSCGFDSVEVKKMLFGSCCLHIAVK